MSSAADCGDVGNVVYDPVADQMLVAVQGRGDLAMIDPASLTVTRRVPFPGCDHGHSLALDADNRLGFIGCEDNATLASVTVDLANGQVTGTNPVGDTPDVLAYDSRHRGRGSRRRPRRRPSPTIRPAGVASRRWPVIPPGPSALSRTAGRQRPSR